MHGALVEPNYDQQQIHENFKIQESYDTDL